MVICSGSSGAIVINYLQRRMSEGYLLENKSTASSQESNLALLRHIPSALHSGCTGISKIIPDSMR
jgi:hypothetical protein